MSERGLTWAVGIPRSQKVYGADVQLVPPTGRKRRPAPDQGPRHAPNREAAAALADLSWRRVTWRQSIKGPLAARFVATRVRVDDGEPWASNRHLPGEEVWLVGEWRSNGERKYYASNLPPRTSLRALAAAIKARWVCEQGHQQLKQELGLGHFEGRSWTGLHRHALMTCMAITTCSTSASPGSARRGGGKMARRVPGPPPSPSPPAIRRAIMARLFADLVTPIRCPHCRRKLRPPPDFRLPR